MPLAGASAWQCFHQCIRKERFRTGACFDSGFVSAEAGHKMSAQSQLFFEWPPCQPIAFWLPRAQGGSFQRYLASASWNPATERMA